MKRHTFAVAVVLGAMVAPVVFHPTAEAETPANQPTAETYPALQKRLAELKAENDRLKDERKILADRVQVLENEIAAIRKQQNGRPDGATDGKPDERSDEIRVGMSLQALEKFCQGKAYLESESTGGRIYIIAKRVDGIPKTTYRCAFDSSGRLVSYTKD